MKYGVVVFPGANCDHDAWYATSQCAGEESVMIWHKDTSIPGDVDCIVLPGGFSYGDYLRCGAIARFSPIMKEVAAFAGRGGHVIGFCNGFQILIEAGMLEGALLRNQSLNFVCKDIYLKTLNNSISYTSTLKIGEVLRIPVAHGEGCYFADEETLKRLEDESRIVFKYCSPRGEITGSANPNGSLGNRAGITNKKGNVMGMMPHPERYSDAALGCDDGLKIFKSIAAYLK